MEEGKQNYAGTVFSVLIVVAVAAGLIYNNNKHSNIPTYQEVVPDEEYEEPVLTECQSFVKQNLKYTWEEYERRKLSAFIDMTEYPYKSYELNKTIVTFQNDNILLTADNTNVRMRILDAKFFKGYNPVFYGVYITDKGLFLFNEFKTNIPELRYSFALLNNSITGGGKLEFAGVKEAYKKDSVIMKDVLTKINIQMTGDNQLTENQFVDDQSIKDPSLKGVGGLKGLRPLTEKEKHAQRIEEISRQIDNGTYGIKSDAEYNQKTWDYINNLDEFKPVGFAGVNDSKYDKDIHTLEDLQDINDFRGRHLTNSDKWANAAFKCGIIAGTTALLTTVGTVAGAGNLVKEWVNGNVDNFWEGLSAFADNPVNRSLDELQEWGEKVAPNYYSNKEREAQENADLWSLLGTANFWSDGVLKLMGFTIGSIAAGAAIGKALRGVYTAAKLVKEGKAALNTVDALNSTYKRAKGLKAIDRFGVATLASVGEASTEAIQTAKTEDLKAVDFWNQNKDEIMLRYAELNLMNDDNIKLANDPEFLEKLGRDYVFQTVGTNPRYTQFTISNSEVGGMQGKPELTEEGKKLALEYGKQLMMLYIQEKSTSYMELAKEDYFNKAKHASKQASGLTFLGNMIILPLSNNIQFGRLLSGGFKTSKGVLNNAKQGLLKTTAVALAKGPGMEYLFEEMGQSGVSTGASYNAAANMNKYTSKTFNGLMYDPNVSELAENYASSVIQGLADTYSDPKLYTDNFSAAIIGLLGMPRNPYHKGEDGKRHIRTPFTGEFWETFEDRNKLNAEAEEYAKQDTYLNDQLKNPKFIEGLKNLVITLNLDLLMELDALNNDKFSFKNHQFQQIMETLHSARVTDLMYKIEDLISTMTDAKAEDIADIRLMMTLKSEDEKTTDFFEGKNDEEVLDHVHKLAKMYQKYLDSYKDVSDKMFYVYGDQFSPEQIKELIFLLTAIKNLEDRSDNMHTSIQVGEKINGILEKYKKSDIGNAIKYLKDLIGLSIENDLSAEEIQEMQQDRETLEKFYDERVDTSKENLLILAEDLAKSVALQKEYMSRLKKYQEHPETIIEDIELDKKNALQTVENKYKKELKNKAVSALNADEFKDAVGIKDFTYDNEEALYINNLYDEICREVNRVEDLAFLRGFVENYNIAREMIDTVSSNKDASPFVRDYVLATIKGFVSGNNEELEKMKKLPEYENTKEEIRALYADSLKKAKNNIEKKEKARQTEPKPESINEKPTPKVTTPTPSNPAEKEEEKEVVLTTDDNLDTSAFDDIDPSEKSDSNEEKGNTSNPAPASTSNDELVSVDGNTGMQALRKEGTPSADNEIPVYYSVVQECSNKGVDGSYVRLYVPYYTTEEAKKSFLGLRGQELMSLIMKALNVFRYINSGNVHSEDKVYLIPGKKMKDNPCNSLKGSYSIDDASSEADLKELLKDLVYLVQALPDGSTRIIGIASEELIKTVGGRDAINQSIDNNNYILLKVKKVNSGFVSILPDKKKRTVAQMLEDNGLSVKDVKFGVILNENNRIYIKSTDPKKPEFEQNEVNIKNLLNHVGRSCILVDTPSGTPVVMLLDTEGYQAGQDKAIDDSIKGLLQKFRNNEIDAATLSESLKNIFYINFEVYASNGQRYIRLHDHKRSVRIENDEEVLAYLESEGLHYSMNAELLTNDNYIKRTFPSILAHTSTNIDKPFYTGSYVVYTTDMDAETDALRQEKGKKELKDLNTPEKYVSKKEIEKTDSNDVKEGWSKNEGKDCYTFKVSDNKYMSITFEFNTEHYIEIIEERVKDYLNKNYNSTKDIEKSILQGVNNAITKYYHLPKQQQIKVLTVYKIGGREYKVMEDGSVQDINGKDIASNTEEYVIITKYLQYKYKKEHPESTANHTTEFQELEIEYNGEKLFLVRFKKKLSSIKYTYFRIIDNNGKIELVLNSAIKKNAKQKFSQQLSKGEELVLGDSYKIVTEKAEKDTTNDPQDLIENPEVKVDEVLSKPEITAIIKPLDVAADKTHETPLSDDSTNTDDKTPEVPAIVATSVKDGDQGNPTITTPSEAAKTVKQEVDKDGNKATETSLNNLTSDNSNTSERSPRRGRRGDRGNIASDTMSAINTRLRKNLTKEKFDKKFEDRLKKIFSKYGIEARVVDNLKAKFGVDAAGVWCAIERIIEYSHDRDLYTLPEEFGHAFFDLFRAVKSNARTVLSLLNSVSSWSGFSKVRNDYSSLSEEGIKIEAIGQAIGKALVKEYKKETRNNFSRIIHKVIDAITNIFRSEKAKSFNKEINSIALEILSDDCKATLETRKQYKERLLTEISNNALTQMAFKTVAHNGVSLVRFSNYLKKAVSVFENDYKNHKFFELLVHSMIPANNRTGIIQEFQDYYGIPFHHMMFSAMYSDFIQYMTTGKKTNNKFIDTMFETIKDMNNVVFNEDNSITNSLQDYMSASASDYYERDEMIDYMVNEMKYDLKDLREDVLESLKKKGYTEELWNQLSAQEQENEMKCL